MDYKIKTEVEENGVIVSQVVRYYQGAVTTENEYVADMQTLVGTLQPVTKYRRTALLEEVEYAYAKEK